jgi:hypothetical protein
MEHPGQARLGAGSGERAGSMQGHDSPGGVADLDERDRRGDLVQGRRVDRVGVGLAQAATDRPPGSALDPTPGFHNASIAAEPTHDAVRRFGREVAFAGTS